MQKKILLQYQSLPFCERGGQLSLPHFEKDGGGWSQKKMYAWVT